MGYRSDVYIAVAFASKSDMEEVLAVYTLDPRVQKADLVKDWEVKEDNILLYSAHDVKWYDNYEDVQGIEYMITLADQFHEERDMPIAHMFIRMGEEIDDIEVREDHGGDDGNLIEKLWDGVQLSRSVEVSL
jgi:hypothetical protein